MNPILNVLLIDDESVCLDTLASTLGLFSYVNIIGKFDNGLEAIKYLQKKDLDLILLDIEMQGINGFEVAKLIHINHPKVMIIFLTGHVDKALDGYEYYPIDYLIKPVNIIRLEKALSKAMKLKYNDREKKVTQIGISVEGGMELVNIDNILYIEKVRRKVHIFCGNGEKFNSSDTLLKLEEIFAEYNFFRTHQSFLVPVDKIKRIYPEKNSRSYVLEVKGVKEGLPLSRDKYNEFREFLVHKGIKIC